MWRWKNLIIFLHMFYQYLTNFIHAELFRHISWLMWSWKTKLCCSRGRKVTGSWEDWLSTSSMLLESIPLDILQIYWEKIQGLQDGYISLFRRLNIPNVPSLVIPGPNPNFDFRNKGILWYIRKNKPSEWRDVPYKIGVFKTSLSGGK